MNSEVIREDVRKLNKKHYSLKDKIVNFYEIPQMQYLITTGYGDRDIYKMYDYKGIWTINRFINRVKYYTKKDLEKNFSRMPIEVEWGGLTELGTEFTAMMWVPDYINEDIFNVTMNDLRRRLDFDFNLSLTPILQRQCAQLLHIGNYEGIETSKQQLLEGITESAFQINGDPQEIFMNHPHCNPPEKLTILLRQEIITI